MQRRDLFIKKILILTFNSTQLKDICLGWVLNETMATNPHMDRANICDFCFKIWKKILHKIHTILWARCVVKGQVDQELQANSCALSFLQNYTYLGLFCTSRPRVCMQLLFLNYKDYIYTSFEHLRNIRMLCFSTHHPCCLKRQLYQFTIWTCVYRSRGVRGSRGSYL